MKMKITRFALTAVLWIGLLAATRAAPLTYYVATNGSHGAFTTWATAATNIQAAVNVSVDDDIIWVTNGTYYCWSNSATAGYTSMVTVTKRVTIQSVNGPAVTIVDANFPFFTNRCFYITATATVAGFTITNGHASEMNNGGGVYIKTSGKVTNCWITGNWITNGIHVPNNTGGGGVYLSGGGEVVNCRIYANITTNALDNSGGAGVCAISGGLIRDCVISNNIYIITNTDSAFVHAVLLMNGCLLTNCTVISNQCAGILMLGSTATVDTCRVVGNIIPSFSTPSSWKLRGAGINIYSADGIVRNSQISDNVNNISDTSGIRMQGGIISNCVISNNYSYYGGAGICITEVSTVALVQDCKIINNKTRGADNGPGGGVYITKNGILRNCLIANNYAFNGGGVYLALVAADTATRVENCTIVSNAALNDSRTRGGGIYCTAGSTGRVVNTIIYSNLSYAAVPSSWNWHTNAPGMTFTNCCTTPTNDLPGSGNISNWPAFVDFSAGNFRLAQGSLCINAGTNLDWMINAVDLDGHRRMDGFSGRPDMGCYEFVPAGTMFRVR